MLRPGYAYCDACRARRCTQCRRLDGTHAPACARSARRCRGCAAALWSKYEHYCDACRATACPECRLKLGQHRATCLYERRRRNPALRDYRGLVTAQDIVDLYLASRAKAVRTARKICGPLFAEDIVSDVVVYLLERRDYLRDVPGESYFMRSVKNGALKVLRSAWHRYITAMDPETLVVVDQIAEAQRRGQRAASA